MAPQNEQIRWLYNASDTMLNISRKDGQKHFQKYVSTLWTWSMPLPASHHSFLKWDALHDCFPITQPRWHNNRRTIIYRENLVTNNVQRLIKSINNDVQAAKDSMLTAKISQAHHANKDQLPEPSYNVGDLVMLTTLRRRREYMQAE